MGLISRLTGDIERNQKAAQRLQDAGLGNSDAAKAARSRAVRATRALERARGQQEGQRTQNHP